MIRLFALALISIAAVNFSFAQTPEKQVVTTHQRTTIITDAKKGERPFARWGVFPTQDKSVRTVKMKVTLGSPDQMPTAHWDYCDIISIRRKGGALGKDLNYEIGRMLTPYGSIFGKGWQWQWEVDVTDFSPLLRDSVEIEYLHTGYEPESVGWALTIEFEHTYGPPIVKPLGFKQIWNGKYKYGDPKEKIEETLTPIDYEAPAGTGISRMRIQHTGHGADRPRNCSEFCTRWRDVYLDGKLVDHRNMWKECSTNPLYPQGGTWIYDRAYWCPGDLQVPDVFDLTTKPGKHNLKMVMEPYTATDNIQAVENISSFLFYYSAPLQAVDAAIEDIVVPTSKQQHFRYNPASFAPRIRIRNNGRNPLTSLVIHYGTEGFAQRSFNWTGNLAFNQVTEVVLPGEVDFSGGTHRFTATIDKPNNKKDAWTGDNAMTTTFNTPRTLPLKMIVVYKTNNNPKDNVISITNGQGQRVFEKRPDTLRPNTLYQDTLVLAAGKYEMLLSDTAGNGLQFWAQPRQGDGYLRLLDDKGRLIHVFESDCGNGELLSFSATPAFVTDTVNVQCAFSMFPRRTRDKIDLEIQASRKANMTVLITVDGILQEKHEYTGLQQGTFTYSLAWLPKGRFVVEVLVDGVRKFTGRVNRD